MIKELNKTYFSTELSYIKDEKILKSGEILVSMLPKYIFEIPASSTGKYHPKYATSNKGLYKHIKVAVKIAKELLVLEMYQNKFSIEEQDLIILALILHDGLKKGIIEEKHTRIDHPLIMSKFIIDNKDKLFLTDKQINILTDAIATHMGQWIYDYKNNKVLDKPETEIQKFVHLCDYLASKKFLNVEFDNNEEIID